MRNVFVLVFFIISFSFFKAQSQNLNDFGTIATGSYTDVNIWRQWDGVGWNTMPASFPNGSTQNVFIRSGHIIVVPGPGPYNTGNVTIENGGKLFSNNSVTNVYLTVWGTNINCNGEVGNGAAFDGIAFNIEGTNCTITGLGTFTASRIRKNSITNTTTLLTIATNVTLRWDQSSNTQFYNNIPSGAANFNLTINAGCTLNCEGSPNSPGNFSMDGFNGTSVASAGGQISVSGTLNIPGTMYATTNNTSTANPVNLVVNNGGLLRVGQINSPASGAAFSRISIQNGGKLELIGLGFPIGTLNWSTTNNRYDFAVGSTIEYSAQAAQNVLTQSNFVATTSPNNQYWHLIVSGSGIKTIWASVQPLAARGNLTITGSAILNQSTNAVDIWVGGNWTNYNQSGFQESTNNIRAVRFYGNNFPTQEIFCPGGEQFQNLVIAKSNSAGGAKVRMLSPVTVNNQLSLGLAGAAVTFGILELNQNALTLNRSDSSAIRLQGPAGYYRYIISEDTITRNSSTVNWKIDTLSGDYVIPFGISNSKDTIPFYFKKYSNNDTGTLTVSTYGTPPNNLPWPSLPLSVTNLNGINNPDNKDYTVDRFWYIGATNQLNCDTIILTYNNFSSSSELPVADPNVQNMKAQYWNSATNGWQYPSQYGVNSTAPYPANSVTISGFNFQNTFWTLSSLNSPLPVELVGFDAEKKDDKIRLFWATASETENDYFKLGKSYDALNFETIGIVNGGGFSTQMHQYEFFDSDEFIGVIYYKLKQVDFNGEETEFPIIPFRNSQKEKKQLRKFNILGQELNNKENNSMFLYSE